MAEKKKKKETAGEAELTQEQLDAMADALLAEADKAEEAEADKAEETGEAGIFTIIELAPETGKKKKRAPPRRPPSTSTARPRRRC